MLSHSVVSDSARLLCQWEFSRKEYWSWLLFPSPGHLFDPGTEPMSLHLLLWQGDSLPLCHLGSLRKKAGGQK